MQHWNIVLLSQLEKKRRAGLIIAAHFYIIHLTSNAVEACKNISFKWEWSPPIYCPEQRAFGTRLNCRPSAFKKLGGLIEAEWRFVGGATSKRTFLWSGIVIIFLPFPVCSNWGLSGMKPLTFSWRYSRSTKKRTCWSSRTGWKTSRASWNILCRVTL